MKKILDQATEDYVVEHSSNEPDLLYRLRRETWLKVLFPNMCSGEIQGAYLRFISQMVQPRRVLEIGTFTAYSTICLAAGLAEDGLIHTIDINEELVEMQKRYIAEAGLSEKIRLHLGQAKEIIPELNEEFDLIFIDADKMGYQHYYELSVSKLRKNGTLLVDNVLWEGKVVRGWDDPETNHLNELNKIIKADDRVENLLLPIRDGLMMVRKK